MILSLHDLFSNNQQLLDSAVSENVIDLGVAGTPVGGPIAMSRDLGQGTKIPVLLQVTEGFAGVTQLKVEVQTDDDLTFSAPLVLSSQTMDAADLAMGKRLSIAVAPYGKLKRYVRLNYTVSGSGTSGRVMAGFTMGNDESLPY